MKSTHLIIPVFLLIFLSTTGKLAAQRKVSVIGKVIDGEHHQPLTGVSVLNISKGTGALSDSSGKYQITATDFDRLVFSYLGYRSDTVQINALYQRQVIDITLQKNEFSIQPVDIWGRRPDYARDSAERREWFSGALNEDKTNGWGAVAHPISALYDALSGRQKRLWRFQKDYKAFEQQKYINARVHPKQITELFDLEGDSLKAFLLWYKPSYYFVRQASDYDLLVDIKAAVQRFRKEYVKNPDADFENQNIR